MAIFTQVKCMLYTIWIPLNKRLLATNLYLNTIRSFHLYIFCSPYCSSFFAYTIFTSASKSFYRCQRNNNSKLCIVCSVIDDRMKRGRRKAFLIWLLSQDGNEICLILVCQRVFRDQRQIPIHLGADYTYWANCTNCSYSSFYHNELIILHIIIQVTVQLKELKKHSLRSFIAANIRT